MNKIKRRINTLISHLRYFGFLDTLSLILVQIFGNTFQPFRDWTILRYFYHNFKHIINKYKYTNYPTDTIADNAPIWVFWAQGVEKMPTIALRCLEQIYKHKGQRELYVLDMNNFFDYIEIPKELIDKVSNKEIGLAHFSDLLRCALLSKHGGIWIDACILLTQDIPNHINNCFYTGSGDVKGRIFSGHWIVGFQGATPNNPLHSCVRDILINYHHMGIPPINYLLLDYPLYLTYQHIPAARRMVDEAYILHSNFHYLAQNRSLIFEEEEIKQALQKHTLMRASYHWEKPSDTRTLYWKIFDILSNYRNR